MKPRIYSALSGLFCVSLSFVGCDKDIATKPIPPESTVAAKVDSILSTKHLIDIGDGAYLFEGDILITRSQLEAALGQKAEIAARTSGTISTIGNQDALIPVNWRANLGYCFDGSFTAAESTTVATAITSAVTSWNALLPFAFYEASPIACLSVPNSSTVYFDIHKEPIDDGDNDPNTFVAAAAFFPGTPQVNRRLIITPEGLAAGGLQATLVHELGHILGLRHEHTHPAAVLAANAPSYCHENIGVGWNFSTESMSGARAATVFDALSIMNYPQCTGTTTSGISTGDQATIRSMYPTVGKNAFAGLNVEFPTDWNIGLNSTSWGVSGHPATSYKPFILDMNRDGYSDVLILGPSMLYTVLSGPSGTYATARQFYPDNFSYPSPVAGYGTNYTTVLGDFNDDGLTDFRRLGGAEYRTYLSNGNGSFTASNTNYGNDLAGNPISDFNVTQVSGNVYGEWVSASGNMESYHSNGYVASNQATDFVRIGPGFMYLFAGAYSNQGYRFNLPAAWGTAMAINYPTLTMDIDGTGRHSVIQLEKTALRAISWNSTANNQLRFNTPTMPAGLSFGGIYGYSYRFLVGDVNGDHRQELFCLGATSAKVVSFTGSFTDGTGAIGTVTTTSGLPNSYGFESAYYDDIVADVNGDNRSDVVRVTSTGTRTFFANSVGSFDIGPTQSITTGFSESRNSLVLVGDADHNGKNDLFAVSSYRVRILKN